MYLQYFLLRSITNWNQRSEKRNDAWFVFLFLQGHLIKFGCLNFVSLAKLIVSPYHFQGVLSFLYQMSVSKAVNSHTLLFCNIVANQVYLLVFTDDFIAMSMSF